MLCRGWIRLFCAGPVKKDAILLWTRFILPSFYSIHLAMLISVYVILLCIQCIYVHGDVSETADSSGQVNVSASDVGYRCKKTLSQPACFFIVFLIIEGCPPPRALKRTMW